MLFTGFPKISRLSRDCIITEKIDGTNGQLYFFAEVDKSIPKTATNVTSEDNPNYYFMSVGSRKRWLTPEDDNFNFAKWAWENKDELFTLLGPGRHYGEWFGSGIQRNYGLQSGERWLSLFNTTKHEGIQNRTKLNLTTVPILRKNTFTTQIVEEALSDLKKYGSFLVPSFKNPEGIVIYHTGSGTLYKKTLENDEQPKGQVEI